MQSRRPRAQLGVPRCLATQRSPFEHRLPPSVCLQDSLGTFTRVVLIACVSTLPGWHAEQTKHTLEFAKRAAHIVCQLAPKLATYQQQPWLSEDDALKSAESTEPHGEETKVLQKEIKLLRMSSVRAQALRRGRGFGGLFIGVGVGVGGVLYGALSVGMKRMIIYGTMAS